MHIVVLGAGAVGGYFGGKLAQTDAQVTFLVRQKRYNQLQSTGLVVKSVHGDFTLKPTVALSADDIENPDVVILALKNYHLLDAMKQVRGLVAKGAKILPLLNGVEHIDMLIQDFGSDTVLGGSCYIESTLDSEGRIIHSSSMQDIVFGRLGNVSEAWMKQLLQAFQLSGVNAKMSNTVLQDMWTKFVFLISVSSLTAAARAPIGVIVNDVQTKELLQKVIKEVLAVSEARKVGLAVEEVAAQTMAKAQSMSESMTSSLHRDLEKGLPLEIESLQGAVVRMGHELGVPVPFTQSVYALLHPYVNGKP